MNAVVNEPGGTAYAARITEPGLSMGGKSGTSQVRQITQYERDHGLRRIDEIPWKERDHALFVGFAPVGAVRYVCATVVEHGGGGSAIAGPICRDVLHAVQQRDPAEGSSASFGGPVNGPCPAFGADSNYSRRLGRA